jgi:hypothetical protein
MINAARKMKGQGVLGQHLATSNENVVVREAVRLGVPSNHV